MQIFHGTRKMSCAMFVAMLLAAWSAPLYAQEAKQKKIHELMEVLGITQELEKVKQMGDPNSPLVEGLNQSLGEQMGKLTPDAPKQRPMSQEEKKAADESYRRYMAPVMARFDPEKMMKTWADAYGESMTEADLDAVLAYYHSTVGRRDVEAQRRAHQKYLAVTISELVGTTGDVMQRFKDDLDAIGKEAEGAVKPRN